MVVSFLMIQNLNEVINWSIKKSNNINILEVISNHHGDWLKSIFMDLGDFSKNLWKLCMLLDHHFGNFRLSAFLMQTVHSHTAPIFGHFLSKLHQFRMVRSLAEPWLENRTTFQPHKNSGSKTLHLKNFCLWSNWKETHDFRESLWQVLATNCYNYLLLKSAWVTPNLKFCHKSLMMPLFNLRRSFWPWIERFLLVRSGVSSQITAMAG